MHAARLLASGAFRFAIAFAAVFAIGSAALLVVVERSVSYYALEAAEDAILAEQDLLASDFHTLGRAALIASIERHRMAVREDQFRYLLTDEAGHHLAGSLPVDAAQPGWHELRVGVTSGADPSYDCPFRTHGTRLDGGLLLVVGSDMSDLQLLRSGLRWSTIGYGAVITLLALVGGLVVATIFLRRLDEVNGAIARIIDGRLTERLPRIGMGPEFDQLSANLNRMLDRIEALMDGLRQVSTDIAHDLRTPLTRLRHRLERMQHEQKPVPEQIEGALAQTDEILRIFSALLRIGTMEARGPQLNVAPVDLSEMMHRLGQLYAPVIEDAEHRLDEAIEPGVVVQGDAELLTQAVINLIENAIHHTPPGSRVSLSLHREGQYARLSVCDDGPGIPKDEHGRVLQRFYRRDASRSTAGAGLGLALVDAIARAHGAELVLADNHPGLRIELLFPA